MPQPYDYSQLVGGFQSPEQAFVGSIKTIEAFREQENVKRLNAQMQADLKDYTANPTPQKLANLHLNYPSLKESLNAYTQTLSDADKKTTTEFATQAFGLNRSGKTDQVLGLFDQYITAAETGGRPDMVRVFRDAKNTYSQIEDPANREALIGSVLASTGKEGLDLYDKIYKSNLDLDTSLIKNVVAMGYKPGTPEFQSEVRRQLDKVTITRPDGTFIQGTPDEIRSILGQGGGTVLPRPKTPEEAGKLPPGTLFIGPDGNPMRVPGGQTGSSPSGNFQRQ